VGVMILGAIVLNYQPVTEEIIGMLLVTFGMITALSTGKQKSLYHPHTKKGQ